MTETYTIAQTAVENVTPNWTILHLKTDCGKEIEFNIEHHEQERQWAGQKAFAFFVNACGICQPVHDSNELHGSQVSVRAWEEAAALASVPAAPPRPFIAPAKVAASSPEKTPTDPDGRFVYVISCLTNGDPLCKIGIARSPEKRVNNLSTSSPHPLRLEFTRYCENASGLERAAHQHFSDRRRNGEWFAMEADEAIEFVVAATRKAAA